MNPYYDKLRTLNQLEIAKFCDFIGEVTYLRDPGNHVNYLTLAMTDYTENDELPYQEGDGRVKGQATILVFLFDEHKESAVELGVAVGHILYLKNLLCKPIGNGKPGIELKMNGFRGKGYPQVEPIRILNPKDPIVGPMRIRKSQHLQNIRASPGASYESEANARFPDLARKDTPAATSVPTVANVQTPQQSVSVTGASTGDALPPSSSTAVPSTFTSSTGLTASDIASPPTSSSPRPASSVVLKTESESPRMPPRQDACSVSPSRPLASPSRPSAKGDLSRNHMIPPAQRAPSKSPSKSPSKIPSVPSFPQLSASSSIYRTGPTYIDVERLRRERRNAGGSVHGIEYMQLRAHVVDYEPAQIIDFSSASCNNCTHAYRPLSDAKVPSICPNCNLADRAGYKYSFKLKLRDIFDQTFDVHVDHSNAAFLLGHELQEAKNLNKNAGRLQKLKTRLSSIGVHSRDLDTASEPLQTLPPSGQDQPLIFFDCVVRLTRVQEAVEALSPELMPLSQEFLDTDGSEEGYSEDDEETRYPLSTQEPFSQPPSSQNLFQKRRADREEIRHGKKPRCNGAEDKDKDKRPHSRTQGMSLQGSDNSEPADFKAFLTCTSIL